MSQQQLVFLVTGASSGLGHSLARAILASGHKLIATMRSPSKTPQIVSELSKDSNNGVCLQLDVSASDLEARLDDCLEAFGRIDVIINNAGYGYGGPLEDNNLDDARKLVETLFWGPMRLTKALIPHFRQRGSGTIVNVTSTEGIAGTPALSFYNASKFALEGASEGLAGELAGFGIRILIVEPGAIRTGFMEPGRLQESQVSEHYKGTAVDYVINAIRGMDGNQGLDPEKCAKTIVEAVEGKKGGAWPNDGMGNFLRLPLGKEFLGKAEEKMQAMKANMAALETVAKSCDFDDGE